MTAGWATLRAQARYLGLMLTADAGVFVVVRYSEFDRQYAITWVGGPDPQAMYTLAKRHAEQVPDIDVRHAALLRTEPT